MFWKSSMKSPIATTALFTLTRLVLSFEIFLIGEEEVDIVFVVAVLAVAARPLASAGLCRSVRVVFCE